MIQELATLTLVCVGISDTPSSETMATTVRSGSQTSTADTIFHGRARTPDTLTVEITGEVVRIKGPASLEPVVSGDGDDGWRTLSDVTINDREIRGQLSYNWFARPLVKIDRMSGEVEIANRGLVSGQFGFRGECERVERQKPRF